MRKETSAFRDEKMEGWVTITCSSSHRVSLNPGPENGGNTEPANSQSGVSLCLYPHPLSLRSREGLAIPQILVSFYLGVLLEGQASISCGPDPTPGMLVWNAHYFAYSQSHPKLSLSGL